MNTSPANTSIRYFINYSMYSLAFQSAHSSDLGLTRRRLARWMSDGHVWLLEIGVCSLDKKRTCWADAAKPDQRCSEDLAVTGTVWSGVCMGSLT